MFFAHFSLNTKGVRFILCVAMLLGITGCLRSADVERTRYYAVSPTLNVETVSGGEWTLGIRPLLATRAYSIPMAFLDDTYQLGYRPRDDWAEAPAISITRAISDALAATGRFSDVGNAADMSRPDLLLTGELRIFHENRTADTPYAEIEVRLELRPALSPGALWAETIRETEPMTSETSHEFAAAMSAAVTRLVEHAAAAISEIDLPEVNRLNSEMPRSLFL